MELFLLFTAVWLRIPFFWDMTPGYLLQNLSEKKSCFGNVGSSLAIDAVS